MYICNISRYYFAIGCRDKVSCVLCIMLTGAHWHKATGETEKITKKTKENCKENWFSALIILNRVTHMRKSPLRRQIHHKEFTNSISLNGEIYKLLGWPPGIGSLLYPLKVGSVLQILIYHRLPPTRAKSSYNLLRQVLAFES